MPELFVTPHAIARYRERVEDVPAIAVHHRLNASAFQIAADFGARYVRFAKGQRAVIIDHRVVTILPDGHAPGRLSMERDHLFDDGGQADAQS